MFLDDPDRFLRPLIQSVTLAIHSRYKTSNDFQYLSPTDFLFFSIEFNRLNKFALTHIQF